MVELATPRLLLREYRGGDWKGLLEVYADPEVGRYEAVLAGAKEVRGFIRRSFRLRDEEPRVHYSLAVETEGRLIGGVRLSIQNREHGEADVAYALNRGFWGRGYATEAVRALLGFGFEKLKLHRIFAACHVENAASIRVLEKAGMTREGRLREHRRFGGRWADSFLYAILDREWNALA